MISENRINNDLVVLEEKNGLQFGTDAYLLAAFVKQKRRGVVLDLCSGNGVIALLLLGRDKINGAYCVDIRENCIELCRKNAEANGFGERITPIVSDCRELRLEPVADMCVCNPPYMKAVGGVNKYTEAYVSRHETSATMADFAVSISKNIKHGGDAYIVYRPDRLCELLVACRAAGIEPKRAVFVYPTTRHEPCLVLLHCKKGGGEGMRVSEPLIMYKECAGGEYSDDLKYIYENMSFPEDFYK